MKIFRVSGRCWRSIGPAVGSAPQSYRRSVGKRMKIATWNVNSIRARVPIVTAWLERVQPDVLLLQETKCLPEKFPTEPFDELHYNIALIGEPSLNGVAVLAKRPIEDVVMRLPGDEDDDECPQ